MKIYVSDDIYEYLAISKRDIHSGVDDDLVVKSLEQHDKELLNKIKSEMLKSIFNDEYIFGKEKRSLHYALGILDGVVDNLLKERGVE